MAAAVHTGPLLETKTNCQTGAELSNQADKNGFTWFLQKFTRNAIFYFFFQVQLLQILLLSLFAFDLGL